MTISVYSSGTDSDKTAESQHVPVMFRESKQTSDGGAVYLLFWYFIQKMQASVKCSLWQEKKKRVQNDMDRQMPAL